MMIVRCKNCGWCHQTVRRGDVSDSKYERCVRCKTAASAANFEPVTMAEVPLLANLPPLVWADV